MISIFGEFFYCTIGIRRSGYKSQIKERPRNAHDDCASSSAGTELSSVKCWLSSAITSSWKDLGDNALFQDISLRSEFLLLIQVHSHLVSAPVDQLPSVVELSWNPWCFSWSIAVQFNQWPRLPCTIFHRDFLDPCGGLFSSRSWGLKLFWCPAWTLCLYLGKIFSVDISSPWVRESHEWTKRRDPLTQRQEFDMKALKVCGPIKPWQFWKWKLRPCWNSVENKSQFLLVSLLILLRVWKLLNYRNLGKSWLQQFDQNWFEFFKNVAFGSFWILLELPVCATVQHRLDPFC